MQGHKIKRKHTAGGLGVCNRISKCQSRATIFVYTDSQNVSGTLSRRLIALNIDARICTLDVRVAEGISRQAVLTGQEPHSSIKLYSPARTVEFASPTLYKDPVPKQSYVANTTKTRKGRSRRRFSGDDVQIGGISLDIQGVGGKFDCWWRPSTCAIVRDCEGICPFSSFSSNPGEKNSAKSASFGRVEELFA